MCPASRAALAAKANVQNQKLTVQKKTKDKAA
jgi:hypothetical protein